MVRLWDARTAGAQRRWEGHTDVILDVAAAGELVVTGSEDGTARVFALGGGEIEGAAAAVAGPPGAASGSGAGTQ